jgi:hypothetical protein
MNVKNTASAFLAILLVGLLSQVSSNVAKADEPIDGEYKNMEQMMGSIRLEKKQVELMVDKMVSSGRISEAEGVKAKAELESMKESDLENLKSRAIAEVKDKHLLDH